MSNSPQRIVAAVPAGVVRVDGAEGVDLINRLSTNELRPLSEAGQVRSTVFTTEKGRVVDWVDVLSMPDHLLVRTSAGRAARVAEWIERYTIMEEVTSVDVSADWVHAVLQGPGAGGGLASEPGGGRVVTDGTALWSRGLAAYGERFDGLLPANAAPAWIAAAEVDGARRAGADELELLRLCAGVPSPAYEFKDEVNPLELRLAPVAVSFDKGCYIGQEVISRLDSYDKLARLLIGFEADEPLPTAGELKLVRDGKTLGRVTSVAASSDGTAIGLAVVNRAAACTGVAQIETPEATVAVRLVERPFWSPPAADG